MTLRKIVQIDEDKCDGCGQCVPACAEGALKIIDGKARLVADVYCDGLGACLGECPRDAITIVEREADPFDEQAVHDRVASHGSAAAPAECGHDHGPAACPGSMAVDLRSERIEPRRPTAERSSPDLPHASVPSRLGNWPVQLRLVPPNAPFLKGADLLLVADCVPFALADFHQRFLGKRPVVVGCPKLDDADFYVSRLAQIITAAQINSLTVVHMEVPCCTGLVRIARDAASLAGSDLPVEEITVAIRGKILAPQAPISLQS